MERIKKITPAKDMRFTMNNDGKIYIIKILHDDFFGYCEIDNTDVMKWKRMSFASFKKHQPRLIKIIE